MVWGECSSAASTRVWSMQTMDFRTSIFNFFSPQEMNDPKIPIFVYFGTSDTHLIKLQSYSWGSEYINSQKLNMEVKVNSSKLICILVEAWKRAGKPFSLNSWFKNPFSPIIMLLCSHRSVSCDMFFWMMTRFLIIPWRPLHWGHMNVLMREVTEAEYSWVCVVFPQM